MGKYVAKVEVKENDTVIYNVFSDENKLLYTLNKKCFYEWCKTLNDGIVNVDIQYSPEILLTKRHLL